MTFSSPTLLIQLYNMCHHCPYRSKHLHDRSISLEEEVWAHKTRLIPTLFIKVTVLRQESEWSSFSNKVHPSVILRITDHIYIYD